MQHLFANKVVWITGGGTGIGAALALEFARHGAKVVVSGRRKDRLETVVSQLSAIGTDNYAVECDVTQVESLQETLDAITKKYGRLDVVVANAGFGVGGPLLSLSLEDWRRQYETNVFGLMMTVKVAFPELVKTKGRVALVASVASYATTAGTGAYASSKAAVRFIGDTLYLELARQQVSVTTLHPGFVESEIGQVDNLGTFRENWEDRRPQFLMWKAADAAKVMLKAIYRRRREYVFTGHGKVAVCLARHFPGLLMFAQKLMAKDYSRGGPKV